MSRNYMLSPSELILFKHDGELLFETLFSPHEIEIILTEIEEARAKRDMFANSPDLVKIYSGPIMKSILRDLFPKWSLRIGFDRLIEADEITLYPFEELTSIQGIEVTCAIDLITGDTTFYSPEKTLPPASTRRLLIGFATGRARYRFNPNDPDTHMLKHQGLVFGDLISFPSIT